MQPRSYQTVANKYDLELELIIDLSSYLLGHIQKAFLITDITDFFLKEDIFFSDQSEKINELLLLLNEARLVVKNLEADKLNQTLQKSHQYIDSYNKNIAAIQMTQKKLFEKTEEIKRNLSDPNLAEYKRGSYTRQHAELPLHIKTIEQRVTILLSAESQSNLLQMHKLSNLLTESNAATQLKIQEKNGEVERLQQQLASKIDREKLGFLHFYAIAELTARENEEELENNDLDDIPLIACSLFKAPPAIYPELALNKDLVEMAAKFIN